jgi:hypothetical protein
MQLSFGPGAMWAERTDVTGSGIGPRRFGLLQDVDLTVAFTSKELYGQNQFPAALARGQGKVTGKSKLARINVRLYSDIFFGLTAASGKQTASQDEAATIPATPIFAITVANASNFVDDLGVAYASNGDPFNRVTTPANAGEYTVNLATGVYTFASPDQNQAVRISYRYAVSTSGFQVTVTNQVQGTTPYFKAVIFQKVSPGAPGTGTLSLPWMVYLPACHSNSLSIPTAQDAWTLNAFDFSAFADPTDTIMIYNADKQ